jgi:epoxyqueuosine reductase
MDWMARTAPVRTDPTHPGMLPGALRVVVLAAPYAQAEPPVGAEPAPPTGFPPGRVARYARGRDYHNVLGKRLRKLVRVLRVAGYRVRASVDALPVLERAWAQRAGVGFIGKNACLIVPGLGSHVFLAALVTDAPLPVDAPMKERCGSCRLCLDACPTDAFAAERFLDARRCISYLTIEHPGPIDPALRPGMGDWLFGCDVCQDVCPYNRTAPPDPAATAPFAPDPACFDREAVDLLTAPADPRSPAWRWTEGSPLRRAGPERLARNAAIVLGNRGEGKRHLPVLERAAGHHPSATVREAADWAIRRLRQR